MTHQLGTLMGTLGVTSPRLWSKPFCFPKIWWSCEVLGGVKSSYTPKDFWAWYVLIPSCCCSLSPPPLFFKLITSRHMHLYFLFGMMLIPFFRFKAIQNTFRLEEMTNSCYQQLDEERKMRAAAVQTLAVAKNSNADLKKKLTVEE